MASFVSAPLDNRFPVGTSLSVYSAVGYRPGQGVPNGPVVTSAAVAADKTVTFAGLADNTAYIAGAVIEGLWAGFSFMTPVVTDFVTQAELDAAIVPPAGSGAPSGANLSGFYEDISTTPSTLYFDGRPLTLAGVVGAPDPIPDPGGGGSGGGTPTPTNTSPTVELANAGISSLADGAEIASWTGVEGTVFSQSVAADRPIKQTVGGNAVARFAGGGDALYTNSPPAGFMSNAEAGTVVVVKRTTANPTSVLGVAGVSTGAATGNTRLMVLEGNTSGKHGLSTRRLDADAIEGPFDESSGSVGLNVWEVVIVEANYVLGTRKLWVNGTQVVDNTITGAAVFPSTSSLDAFTRADGGLGADWTTVTYYGGAAPRIVSNAVRPVSGGYFSLAYHDVATFGPDSEVFFDITTTSSGWGAAGVLRFTSDGTWGGTNCYYVQVNNGSVVIGKVVNGTATPLASGTVAWANGDKVGLRRVGSTLTAYRYTAGAWGQTPVLTTTDSSLTGAGYVGMWLEDGDSTLTVDNFGGGTYVPPGAGNVGNVSATGALRMALGNLNNLGAGFVGDIYAAAYYNRALTQAQREFLTTTYLTTLGANQNPTAPPGGTPGSGSHGTLVLNTDFSTGLIDTSKWQIGNPDQPSGSAWYNTADNNVFIYNDPVIGTVCRLKCNYSNGRVTTSGMLNSRNRFTVAPAASGDSILLECIMRTPNVQGAWPTFWAYSYTNANEWDVVEIFGRPWEIVATYHAITYANATHRIVNGAPYDGLHSFAMRITTTEIIAYYDRVQIGSAMVNQDNFSNMFLVCSLQGLAEATHPWSSPDQQLVGSGSYYQDIKRVTVWRGGTGPPPA